MGCSNYLHVLLFTCNVVCEFCFHTVLMCECVLTVVMCGCVLGRDLMCMNLSTVSLNPPLQILCKCVSVLEIVLYNSNPHGLRALVLNAKA